MVGVQALDFIEQPELLSHVRIKELELLNLGVDLLSEGLYPLNFSHLQLHLVELSLPELLLVHLEHVVHFLFQLSKPLVHLLQCPVQVLLVFYGLGDDLLCLFQLLGCLFELPVFLFEVRLGHRGELSPLEILQQVVHFLFVHYHLVQAQEPLVYILCLLLQDLLLGLLAQLRIFGQAFLTDDELALGAALHGVGQLSIHADPFINSSVPHLLHLVVLERGWP